MTDMAVLLSAQAVAMRAMINDLDQMAVDDMRQLAEELRVGQALFRAIMQFCTQYQLVRRDPEALKVQGEMLRDAVAQPSRGGIDG